MVAAVQRADSPDLRIVTEIRGAPARLFSHATGGEVIISGSAGTGKTRAILEWLHRRCATESRLRVLMVRKTQESLKASALVTYTTQVLHEFDGKQSRADGVTYYGGSGIRPADLTYEATGSKIVIAGMDRISKVLSTEWDCIYVNECTELSLAEWEQLSARVNRPTMDLTRPLSLLLGDCNPDAPTHWIMKRATDGKLQLWTSRHEDNPAMWDKVRKVWTASGQRYIDTLDRLSGVRYQRLRLGKWAAAEGQVYETWNPDHHMINAADIEIPYQWPRFWVVDFGYIHPFVWQWWAQGPDGQLVRYREIYMTRRLVEEHALLGMQLSANEPRPMAIITDHDAEDRATFEAKTGYATTPAKKTVRDGIQAVLSRLNVENKRPGLIFVRDALVEVDKSLEERALPTCTEEEFPVYIWAPDASGQKAEQPVKEYDHGMDATRYLVAHFDLEDGSGIYDDTVAALGGLFGYHQ